MSPESKRVSTARAAFREAVRARVENPTCPLTKAAFDAADKEYSEAWAAFHKAKSKQGLDRSRK